MSAASCGVDQSNSDGGLKHARSLLIEALDIIDLDDQLPEVGARLQGVIDAVEDRLEELMPSSGE